MLKTARQIAWVAAPKLSGGALTLCANILLLRVWSPEAYGTYALCLTIILLADAVLGSSIDWATLRLASTDRPADPAAAHGIEHAALQLKLLGSAAALPLVALAANPLAGALFGENGTGATLLMTFAAAAGLLIFRSILIHAQLQQRFESYALLEAIHSGVKFGGLALLLLLTRKPSVDMVLTLYVAGPATALAVGLMVFRHALLSTQRVDAGRVRELVRYVRWYALSGAVGNLLGRADLFILAALSTAREVGLFAGAQTFASVLWLVASYLAVVMTPRIMPALERNEYRELHRRVHAALYGLACFILVAALAVLDGPLLALLPAPFRESSNLLRILLLGTAVSFATVPLALPLVMFLRPRFTLLMDCVAAPVLVLLYAWAIAAHGAEGAAWVTTASSIVRGSIVQIAGWRLSSRPLASGQSAKTACDKESS